MAILKPQPPAKRRTLHKGDQGKDVLAAQRALRKALYKLGYYPVNHCSSLYGNGTLLDTLRFQRREGIVADGHIGTHTWIALDPYLDAYGKLLLTPKPKPPTPPGIKVAHEAVVLATLAPRHYTQTRPYAGSVEVWRVQGGDCSGTSILIYKEAGQPDPNGTNYNGSGYTGSLDKQGVRVDEAQTAPGDLIFYGPGSSEHVTVAIGGGQCVSHGSEGGPRTLPVHYRGDFLQVRRYV